MERLDVAAARKRNNHGSALSDLSATHICGGRSTQRAARRTNARMMWGSQVHDPSHAAFSLAPCSSTSDSRHADQIRFCPRRLRLCCARPLPLAVAMPVLTAAPTVASAQGSVPIVRDAEIEALVRDYARPILGAAGLSKSNIDIILVNDRRFNAFVAGRRIFINTGALAAGGNAQRNHRRPGARGRPHRRRPSGAPARTARAGADHGDRGRPAWRRRGCRGCCLELGRSWRRPAPASPLAAANSRGAGCSATSAPRKSPPTARPSPISSATRPVGQGHAEDLRALPERAVALRHQGRSLSGQPSGAARTHRQPGDAGASQPLFRHAGFADAAAAARPDAGQDRRLHPGQRKAPRGFSASSGAVWRPPMRKQSRLTSTAIRAPPSPRPTR